MEVNFSFVFVLISSSFIQNIFVITVFEKRKTSVNCVNQGKVFKFIQVTVVNKILQVLSVQFYNASSVHCVVFTTQSQISFLHRLFDPLYPLLPPPHFPLVTTKLSPESMSFCLFVFKFILTDKSQQFFSLLLLSMSLKYMYFTSAIFLITRGKQIKTWKQNFISSNQKESA